MAIAFDISKKYNLILKMRVSSSDYDSDSIA